MVVASLAWIACHNGAFQRLGGVPAVNRIDNERTAMSVGAGSRGTVHPVYAAYARTMNFHVNACEVRQPQAKGKGEAKVKLARRIVITGRRVLSFKPSQVLKRTINTRDGLPS